jgi:integrase
MPGDFVRVLLLTGSRRSEAAGMRWSEIDESQRIWQLPRERTKNGVPHTVPLSSQVWEIIAARPRFADCDFVFSADGRRSIGGFSRLKHALDARMGPTTPWVLHDLRRVLASGMQKLGIRVEVVEQVLNHRSGTFGGIVGVYQRFDYLDEKRDALQRWANHVEQLVTGKPATVVSLRSKRR